MHSGNPPRSVCDQRSRAHLCAQHRTVISRVWQPDLWTNESQSLVASAATDQRSTAEEPQEAG